jgi:UDP-GlcNAc3NAcA epimerase
MKILSVVGARPQFIKAAVVCRAFKECNRDGALAIEDVLLHTGQHFDANMNAVFFRDLEIPRPRYRLEIDSLPHGAMTGRMIEAVEKVLLREKPDWVLVYGDTNSTLAGALAARKLHARLAHVEAGLRSGNWGMPEEQNRILTDRISDLLFCPTRSALENLEREGVSCSPYGQECIRVGDVMFDAALHYAAKAEARNSSLPETYVLATVHRAANTDSRDNLEGIFSALREIAREVPVILPLHPRTRKSLSRFKVDAGTVRLVDPVGYLDMISLEKNSEFILTDSGGIQKEAFFFRKPCVTLRDETEWVELVEAGVNFLAGADTRRILAACEEAGRVPGRRFGDSPYGEGDAGKRIVEILLERSREHSSAPGTGVSLSKTPEKKDIT